MLRIVEIRECLHWEKERIKVRGYPVSWKEIEHSSNNLTISQEETVARLRTAGTANPWPSI